MTPVKFEIPLSRVPIMLNFVHTVRNYPFTLSTLTTIWRSKAN